MYPNFSYNLIKKNIQIFSSFCRTRFLY